MIEFSGEEVRGLHSAFLFHHCGWEALKSMCTLLSGTLSSPFIPSWKDLAAHLHLSIHEIGCIENYKLDDCTVLVLKTFAQTENATLDKIVNALVEMKRTDVITSIWPHLMDLKKFVVQNQLTDDEKSLNEAMRALSKSLPITLSIGSQKALPVLQMRKDQLTLNMATPVPQLRSGATNTRRGKTCSMKVMLTFGPDGESAAKEVAALLRKPRGHILPIGALILDEHYETVVLNPEEFITKYYQRVDYVIPILTLDYLDLISRRREGWIETEPTSLDAKYAQFIYNLMMHQYTTNSCLNKKVRCLIPPDQIGQVSSHPLLTMRPILQVALPLSDTERLARQLLMAKLKIKDVPPPS